jgi:hypothetical protein
VLCTPGAYASGLGGGVAASEGPPGPGLPSHAGHGPSHPAASGMRPLLARASEAPRRCQWGGSGAPGEGFHLPTGRPGPSPGCHQLHWCRPEGVGGHTGILWQWQEPVDIRLVRAAWAGAMPGIQAGPPQPHCQCVSLNFQEACCMADGGPPPSSRSPSGLLRRGAAAAIPPSSPRASACCRRRRRCPRSEQARVWRSLRASTAALGARKAGRLGPYLSASG